jgi:Carbohydrate family 9 binding domain-like
MGSFLSGRNVYRLAAMLPEPIMNVRAYSFVACTVLASAPLIGVVLLTAGASPRDESNAYTSDAQIMARSCKQDFTPDGDLAKPAWKAAQWVEFDHDMTGRRSYPGAATRVAALWSRRYVYFGFSCRYDRLNVYQGEDPAKERWELWNRDVVEVFLNPQPEHLNHYYEFEVAPNNQWIDLEIDKTKVPFNDAAWNSGFTHATRVGASGDAPRRVWTCEMRVPIAALAVTVMPPQQEWRINFFRADGPSGPGNNNERRFLAWSTIPEGTTFHTPSRFGRLRFVER